MSEQHQHRESRQPGALNSMLLLAGIIGGTIALVVVLLFGGLGIFHNGIEQGTLGQIVVGGIVLILVGAIPGILIGLKVFRGFKKRASSRTVLIVVPAFSGIVGGVVVAGAVTLCFVLWYVATYCC
jgi:hypothetical protein